MSLLFPSLNRAATCLMCLRSRGLASTARIDVCQQRPYTDTHEEDFQFYLRTEELEALRKAAGRSRRSVAALVRDAVRKVVLMPPEKPREDPVAI